MHWHVATYRAFPAVEFRKVPRTRLSDVPNDWPTICESRSLRLIVRIAPQSNLNLHAISFSLLAQMVFRSP